MQTCAHVLALITYTRASVILRKIIYEHTGTGEGTNMCGATAHDHNG